MAQLVFNVPTAALSDLDAYAQELRFIDFHDFTVQWMKEQVRFVRKRANEQQAKALVSTDPPAVVIV